MKDDKKKHDINNKQKELELELEETNNKYLRALADYQNLERQTQVWREDFIKFANQNLIIQLLEILDNLEKAGEHLKDEGLKLIIDKLRAILKNNGVEELDLIGKEYNPNEAEVINLEPGEIDNIIVKVLQKGYLLNNKVIRPAKVVVSKKE